MLRCRAHTDPLKTSPPTSATIPLPPAASLARDGHLESELPSPPSPTLSTTSTADGEDEDDDIELSPTLPPLPPPSLPERASAILRAPPVDFGDSKAASDHPCDIASRSPPPPRPDPNLPRRQSFSSEASDDFPVHQLDISTPFLRPPPAIRQSQPHQSSARPSSPLSPAPHILHHHRHQQPQQPLPRAESEPEPHSAVSAAAAVLANRVRRQSRGLTEGWIRTHTAAAENVEPRHWLSDGSSGEDSYRGSDNGWLHESEPLTPTPPLKAKAKSRSRASSRLQAGARHYRLRSSVETVGSSDSATPKADSPRAIAVKDAESAMEGFVADAPRPLGQLDGLADASSSASKAPVSAISTAAKVKLPATPMKITDKPLPKEPPITPRIKKKVPWKGKNIMILIPRDEDRGLPGQPPIPLSQIEVDKMFLSWRGLGYSTDGFDLLVERYPSTETGYPHSRLPWPSPEDLADEKATGQLTVVLPDLNAWKNYVHELQEAKLRALGVSFGNDEPELAPPISSQPSRLPSAQYPPLPFSPPLPTSSASSNHGVPGLPFPPQFMPGGHPPFHSQSPALPSGASPVPFGAVPGKYPRQSISFPTTHSPFQQSPHGWPAPPGAMQGMNRHDSPSLMNMGAVLSSQAPYGLDGMQQAGSPAFNIHQRHQSLQYLPQPVARASPRLQDVREDEEEEEDRACKVPAETPESAARNADSLQAEIDDAEYHLEEQLRNELEHEDYNPHAPVDPGRDAHQAASAGFAPAEHFANEPGNNLVLHHPRPHSRGHSLSKSFFRDQVQDAVENAGGHQQFGSLKNIPESRLVDDHCEIETNPSNLGTPLNMDFPAAFHNKTLSTVSNPWQDAVSANSSARHSSHGSKQSSKFNVDAPVFKFNPTNSFTPGLFNFSNSSNHNHNGGFHDSHNSVIDANPFASVSAPPPSKINAAAPAFAPGQGEFNFSAPGGLKFRPDAPPFTPLGAHTAAAAPSPLGPRHDPVSRGTKSLSGDLDLDDDDNHAPRKEPRAIVRRSSTQSTLPGAFQEDNDLDGFDVFEGSRAKRAKSVALDGDEIPLFAERPEPDSLETVDEDTVKETRSEPDEEGDQARRAESSFSSASLDQLDTQITTAAPSEASPANRTEQKWNPRDSQSNIESPSEKRPLGEDTFKSSASVSGLMSTCDEPESVLPPAASTPKRAETTPARRKLTPKGLSSSRFASPPAKPVGLAGSRFARSPSPIVPAEDDIIESVEREFERDDSSEEREIPEPTFEEIDAVMQHFETDPSMGINKVDAFKWADAEPADLAPEDLQPLLREARSMTPRGYDDVADLAAQPLPTTELEDPFLDPPIDLQESRQTNGFDDRGSDSEMDCDWEGTFAENEHSKLQTRAQFFDTRVNDLVGDILASRLEPLAKTLFSIHHSLASKGSQRGSSSRRDMRSASTEYQESDADDEDDEPPPRRSISPKRDRRLEQIRLAVTEALASQRGQSALNLTEAASGIEESAVLKTLVEIKEQLVTRSIAHDVASQTFTEHSSVSRADDWAIKAIGLEQRLQFEQEKLEREILERRSAEDTAAELTRKLHAAESRVEAEVIHRSVFDKRVADLEDRLRSQEEQTEEEIKSRHAAEDQLSEVQRLLRFSSDEETRLAMVLEEKDHRVKSLEQSGRDMAVKVATLESARDEWTRTSSEMNSRVHLLEADLRAVRQDNNNWRAEAERAGEAARRKTGELAHTVDENKRLQKSLDNVVSQLEENERLRESWRAKFLSLQEDMGKAAREVAEENARFIKRDQAMLARSEVLEARLHAEAKTRERLEIEMERLQHNERAAMRAVNESKRLEEMLADLRTENAKLQQGVSKYQREFEEARESGASEVKRTRITLQTEVDAANNQVNVIREELEEQNTKLRAEVDSLKAQHGAELEELKRKHLNEAEELRARYERQLTIAVEDGHRTEQHLRERLSLSLSKTEHFQDRILHLEDKLEITRQAAAAAAQAAKQAGVEAGAISVASKAISLLPEKVSPQALRESILVLQEQLQSREQRIEELEQTVAGLDPDAANKISKRDDEISWLRELLSVRHGDLQDIITALSRDNVDRVAIKDAAIRLKANLQMEEQERERAMNGGSAISLPNIAQTLQAATPRVAQTIAPIAAAWGNWRKTGSTPSFRGLSGVLSGATLAAPSLAAPAVAAHTATPAKSGITSTSTQHSGSVSGLLTPPASGLRQPSPVDERPQPTAFSSTGRRYPMVSSSFERRTRRDSDASRLSPQRSSSETPFRRSDFQEDPMTPPMMHQSIYDEDARPGNFDEHDFFEED